MILENNSIYISHCLILVITTYLENQKHFNMLGRKIVGGKQVVNT